MGAREAIEAILYDWHSTEMKSGSLALPSQRWKLADRIVDESVRPRYFDPAEIGHTTSDPDGW